MRFDHLINFHQPLSRMIVKVNRAFLISLPPRTDLLFDVPVPRRQLTTPGKSIPSARETPKPGGRNFEDSQKAVTSLLERGRFWPERHSPYPNVCRTRTSESQCEKKNERRKMMISIKICRRIHWQETLPPPPPPPPPAPTFKSADSCTLSNATRFRF